ncbi:hypothetical protein PTKIN_Ptkin17bG0132000 [Pterospermum kingtungense]
MVAFPLILWNAILTVKNSRIDTKPETYLERLEACLMLLRKVSHLPPCRNAHLGHSGTVGRAFVGAIKMPVFDDW